MKTYEFHGSIRIEAKTEQEALNVLDQMERGEATVGCEIHTNDMEVVK
jgi:hypothetical protein